MNELDQLREKIDTIDQKLLKLLARRFSLVAKIGKFKKENNVSIRNPDREKEVLTRLVKQTKGTILSQKLVQSVWNEIFKHSYKLEQ